MSSQAMMLWPHRSKLNLRKSLNGTHNLPVLRFDGVILPGWNTNWRNIYIVQMLCCLELTPGEFQSWNDNRLFTKSKITVAMQIQTLDPWPCPKAFKPVSKLWNQALQKIFNWWLSQLLLSPGGLVTFLGTKWLLTFTLKWWISTICHILGLSGC